MGKREWIVRCSSCGAYEWTAEGKCKFCGRQPPTEPQQSQPFSGNVDIWEMAKALKNKRIQEMKSKIPQLSDCPDCKQHSLFFNGINENNQFECLNTRCNLFNKPVMNTSDLYKQIIDNVSKG